MQAAIRELDRLARGPFTVVSQFEAVLMSSFTATQERVHVMTGQLKASGHPSSSFTGDVWEGVLHYARHPGIFELARGDQPTLNHPEGEHYFFDPAYHTGPEYERVFYDFLDGGA